MTDTSTSGLKPAHERLAMALGILRTRLRIHGPEGADVEGIVRLFRLTDHLDPASHDKVTSLVSRWLQAPSDELVENLYQIIAATTDRDEFFPPPEALR